jgi:predicted amidophosphoribosyltransferase
MIYWKEESRTETQTRKTKLNRWENISGVFGVKVPGSLKGKKVLLVDDVITTGSPWKRVHKYCLIRAVKS